MIYWAWGRNGRIEDEAFQAAKETGELDVLATVKFNSTLIVTPGMTNENTEDVGTIYYIIASDRLLEAYVDVR